MNYDDLKAYKVKARNQRDNWKRRATTYENAILETLRKNPHLAAGDDCALAALKRALAACERKDGPK